MTTTDLEAPRRSRGLRDSLRSRRQSRYADYDAFVSYSRVDVDLAVRLHRSLERFAKPWNRVRSLKIYRDMSSLSPEAGLWTALERGLERSTWFILIASPESARSRWVDRELSWWLEHRSIDRILMVVTGDEVTWDEEAKDFDAQRCDWVPPALRGRFDQEPAVIHVPSLQRSAKEELPIEELTGTLFSVIRGIPKDEAFAEAVRHHRRTIRLARAGVVSLVVLLVVAVVAGLVARSQRNTAADRPRWPSPDNWPPSPRRSLTRTWTSRCSSQSQRFAATATRRLVPRSCRRRWRVLGSSATSTCLLR